MIFIPILSLLLFIVMNVDCLWVWMLLILNNEYGREGSGLTHGIASSSGLPDVHVSTCAHLNIKDMDANP